MRAHPVSLAIPIPVDNILLDEEFDVFETATPSDGRPDIGRLSLVCDNIAWDEYDNDDKEIL